jgi:hypothetical protein
VAADGDAPAWTTARTVDVARHIVEIESTRRRSNVGTPSEIRPHTIQRIDADASAQDCQPTATFRYDVRRQRITTGDHGRGSLQTVEGSHGPPGPLNAKEKEILESHLVMTCPAIFMNRCRSPKNMRKMNTLENRPMSSGMKLRLVWRLVEDADSNSLRS